MSAYQEVLAALPSLTARQLGEIVKRANLLLKLQNAAAPTESGAEHWIFNGVLVVARENGLRVPPLTLIRKARNYLEFIDFSTQMQDRIVRRTEGLDKSSRQALGVLVARSLWAYMMNRGWEMTFDSMLAKADVIPAAIEASYPGYLESGLLKMLIRTET